MVLLSEYTVPTHGVRYSAPDVRLNIEDDEIGLGTLYITESCVLWLNCGEKGMRFDYKQINFHGVCRDLESFPDEHLLCVYEGKLPGFASKSDKACNANNNIDDDEGDGDDAEKDDESVCTTVEIRFVPEKKESLDAIFEAIVECQKLHPESDNQFSEDEFENGGGDVSYGPEEIMGSTLDNLLQSGQGDAAVTSQVLELSLDIDGELDEPVLEPDQFDLEDRNDE